VLGTWRRKEEFIWIPDEDESFAKMNFQDMDNDEIVHSVEFKKNSQADVKTKRAESVSREGKGGNGEKETALGKLEYSWMK
jgi:hypothetical protein